MHKMADRKGKGWARGLTSATDPRVAKCAAAHRGIVYQRRKPLAECKWSGASTTTLPLEWSEPMAYLVGLIATDGCLISGRRRIDFKSADRQLVETYLQLLGRTNRIRRERTRTGGVVFVTQIGDTKLYQWLASVGLTPRKSLTIGAICVPDQFLLPLVRGLLDGDGSIINGVWQADTPRRSGYYWEWLVTRFVSGSRAHLEWLHGRIRATLPLRGWIAKG